MHRIPRQPPRPSPLIDTLLNPIFVNGRYTVQPQSGVQRFAGEVVAALASSWPVGRPPPTLLLPPDAPEKAYPLPTIRVGSRNGGVAWEQIDLPRQARAGLLVNLGNTGPILVRKQMVVIHDAGAFARPEAYSWKFRAWYRLLQPTMARRGVRVVTVSEFSRRELARYLRLDPTTIPVLPEGGEHILREPANTQVLAANALVPGRFVLVVGNLAAHKNLSALSQTAHALASRGLDLVITGSLDRTVFEGTSRLPQPARYVGRVDDASLRALYETAACFLFPSLYEGCGLPALEAMACGCPLVLSDIPAFREVAGTAAHFFDPASPDEIVRRVCEVVDDAALADRLRREGAHRAAQFGWSKAADSLRGIIDTLACW